MTDKIQQTACPCNSDVLYTTCCEPYHLGELPDTAERLMRSRYSAFVLGKIDYIIDTTVPAQRDYLNRQAISDWSQQTSWLSLDVIEHAPKTGKRHAQVEFEAHFLTDTGKQTHQERSTFMTINGRWYFLDPTVDMPISQKQPCFCGSGEKFKRCCGRFL